MPLRDCCLWSSFVHGGKVSSNVGNGQLSYMMKHFLIYDFAPNSIKISLSFCTLYGSLGFNSCYMLDGWGLYKIIIIINKAWSINVVQCTQAGVLKKLSLASLGELSRLRHSWLRFGLASAGYRALGVHDRQCTQPANSQLIPQSMMKYGGLACLG